MSVLFDMFDLRGTLFDFIIRRIRTIGLEYFLGSFYLLPMFGWESYSLSSCTPLSVIL